MRDIFAQVEKNMDDLVAGKADWTASADKEQLDAARNGNLKLMFFGRAVPDEWLPDLKGKKVLCLAGAGGLQAPLLACAGADVTVLDISGSMLAKDIAVAKQEQLQIRTVKGNMCDLSAFADASFDLILNPPSLMYVPEPRTVFRECSRVLRQNGVLIIAAPCPVNYLCDYIADGNGGYYRAVHRMPYCSQDFDDSGWIEYGHTMETYLGGLTACGFQISGYLECQLEDITELYFMVQAVRSV